MAVALFSAVGGFNRDRGFYPTLLAVVATYYVLFATMAGSASALWTESAVLAGFLAIAIWGNRRNLWWVVAGLVAHGTFDALHATLAADSGAPEWWPAFCLAFDVTAAAFLAYAITFGATAPTPTGTDRA